ERLERLGRDERRRRAADERLVAELDAAPDRDEEVAPLDAPRADLHAGDLVRGRVELAEWRQLVDPNGDHAAAPSRRSASRATSRSSNGIVPSANCFPCSWPFPAITTTSPSAASPIARAIALRRSGSTSASAAP